MPTLFIYGSLKVPKIFKTITGLHLKEYHEAQTKGKLILYEDFPVAFPDEEQEIHGLVVDLPYEVIHAIDTFEEEGRLMLRQEVPVYFDDNEEKAFIYWGNSEHPAFYNIHTMEIISDGIWKQESQHEFGER